MSEGGREPPKQRQRRRRKHRTAHRCRARVNGTPALVVPVLFVLAAAALAAQPTLAAGPACPEASAPGAAAVGSSAELARALRDPAVSRVVVTSDIAIVPYPEFDRSTPIVIKRAVTVVPCGSGGSGGAPPRAVTITIGDDVVSRVLVAGTDGALTFANLSLVGAPAGARGPLWPSMQPLLLGLVDLSGSGQLVLSNVALTSHSPVNATLAALALPELLRPKVQVLPGGAAAVIKSWELTQAAMLRISAAGGGGGGALGGRRRLRQLGGDSGGSDDWPAAFDAARPPNPGPSAAFVFDNVKISQPNTVDCFAGGPAGVVVNSGAQLLAALQSGAAPRLEVHSDVVVHESASGDGGPVFVTRDVELRGCEPDPATPALIDFGHLANVVRVVNGARLTLSGNLKVLSSPRMYDEKYDNPGELAPALVAGQGGTVALEGVSIETEMPTPLSDFGHPAWAAGANDRPPIAPQASSFVRLAALDSEDWDVLLVNVTFDAGAWARAHGGGGSVDSNSSRGGSGRYVYQNVFATRGYQDHVHGPGGSGGGGGGNSRTVTLAAALGACLGGVVLIAGGALAFVLLRHRRVQRRAEAAEAKAVASAAASSRFGGDSANSGTSGSPSGARIGDRAPSARTSSSLDVGATPVSAALARIEEARRMLAAARPPPPARGGPGAVGGAGGAGGFGAGSAMAPRAHGSDPGAPPAAGPQSGGSTSVGGGLAGGAAGDGEHIVLDELLGEGAFGRVYRGKWRGSTVAVKVMALPRAEKREKMAIMETAISSSLVHPTIVATYTYALVPAPVAFGGGVPSRGALATGFSMRLDAPAAADGADGGANANASASPPESGALYGDCDWEVRLVLEYCDRGTLREQLTAGCFRLPGGAGADYGGVLATALDVARAMAFLHERGIAHADLKARNVLLKSTSADPRGWISKVGDFGLSLRIDPDKTHASDLFQGTITHMAPEILDKGRISTKSDVYAFGILLWELVTGASAFAGVPKAILGYEIAKLDRRPVFPPGTPLEYQLLACRCWDPDPAARPPFDAVVLELERLQRRAPPAGAAGLLPPPAGAPDPLEPLCGPPLGMLALELLRRAKGSGGGGVGGVGGGVAATPAPAPPHTPVHGGEGGEGGQPRRTVRFAPDVAGGASPPHPAPPGQAARVGAGKHCMEFRSWTDAAYWTSPAAVAAAAAAAGGGGGAQEGGAPGAAREGGGGEPRSTFKSGGVSGISYTPSANSESAYQGPVVLPFYSGSNFAAAAAAADSESGADASSGADAAAGAPGDEPVVPPGPDGVAAPADAAAAATAAAGEAAAAAAPPSQSSGPTSSVEPPPLPAPPSDLAAGSWDGGGAGGGARAAGGGGGGVAAACDAGKAVNDWPAAL